jgi:hypothetical protein
MTSTPVIVDLAVRRGNPSQDEADAAEQYDDDGLCAGCRLGDLAAMLTDTLADAPLFVDAQVVRHARDEVQRALADIRGLPW